MNENYLRPPQEDIDRALEIEKSVTTEEMPKYLAYLNTPMSKRNTPRELRDGCILTGLFVQYGRQ